MIYQMTFAIITVALVAGAVADRMRFSALRAGSRCCGCSSSMCRSRTGCGAAASCRRSGVLDFAGGTVVHINAGVAGLVAALVLGKRRGYGTENLAPYDLSLAVIGTGLLWVGWFGFNGGSALGAGSRAAHGDRRDASRGLRRRAHLDGRSNGRTRGKPSVLGIISGAVAGLGTITPASGFVLPWHGIVIGIVAGGGLLLGLHQAQAAGSAMTTRSTCSACTASAASSASSLTGVFATAAISIDAGRAERLAGPDRRQSAPGADPALRRRRDRRVVGRLHLRDPQARRRRHRAAVTPEAEQMGLDVTQHGESIHS